MDGFGLCTEYMRRGRQMIMLDRAEPNRYLTSRAMTQWRGYGSDIRKTMQ